MTDFFSRPVVCNTGPVIGLSRAGLCGLLTDIFPRMLIPAAVRSELLAGQRSGAAQIAALLQAAEVVAGGAAMDPFLAAELDPGEAAVIATARQENVTGVLIDERKGRRVAKTIYGLDVRGTCGLLLEAKRRGLIAEVSAPLTAMIAGGYFVGPKVRAECLQLAGE